MPCIVIRKFVWSWVVRAEGMEFSYLHLNEQHLFRLTEGQTHFSTSWHVQMSVTLNELSIDCSPCKPSHHLQACTQNLPNMKEGVLCKTTNSQPKVMLSSRKSLLYLPWSVRCVCVCVRTQLCVGYAPFILRKDKLLAVFSVDSLYGIGWLKTNPQCLAHAVEAVNKVLLAGVKPVLVVGPKIRVAKACKAIEEFADASGYAVAVMPSGKGQFRETHPNFIGTYWGAVSSPYTSEIVESSDVYIFAGPLFNDYR